MIQGDSIDTKPVVKNEVGACWYKNCPRCFLNVLAQAILDIRHLVTVAILDMVMALSILWRQQIITADLPDLRRRGGYYPPPPPDYYAAYGYPPPGYPYGGYPPMPPPRPRDKGLDKGKPGK